MQGTQGAQTIIRLGDLLVEAGYISAEQIERALDYSRKNFMALGRVLVVQKLASDEEVKDALELQKSCKLDGMCNSVAVRALKMKREQRMSLQEALKNVGWIKQMHGPFEDPQSVMELREKLRALSVNVGTEGRQSAQLLLEVGDKYIQEGLHGRAESSYYKALETLSRIAPPPEGDIASVLLRMARLLVIQKEHKGAKALHDQIRQKLEELGLENTAEYANLFYEMGDCLEAQRKFNDAERAFSKCLSVRLGFLEVDDPAIVEAVKRITAVCKRHSGDPEVVSVGDLLIAARLATAEQIAEALKIGKEKGISPLGRVLVHMKLIEDHHLQMALQVQVLVRNHEITGAIGGTALKMVLSKKVTLDEALQQLGCRVKETAQSNELMDAHNKLMKLERQVEPDEPALAYACGQVGMLYYQRQRWSEAEQLFMRGMAILKKAKSLDEESAEFLEAFASLRLAQQQIDDATALLRSAVSVRVQKGGQASLAIAKDLEQLGAAECIKGAHAAAVNWFSKAVTLREKLQGSYNVELAAVLEMLGDCYMHSNEHSKAVSIFRRALTMSEDKGGRENNSTQRIVDKLIVSCREIGDRSGAEALENAYGRGSRGLIL